MRKRAWIPIALGLAVATLLAQPVPAAKRERQLDRYWVHPELPSFGVDRIAMMPVASFDNNLKSEKDVEAAIAQSLKDTGYRWLSANSTRDQLRGENGKDSVLAIFKAQILKNGRLDSLATPALAAELRCDALLGVRVDRWEKHDLEWTQSGKPSTTVQLTATLVDSSGTLLWSASGSQTAEGPYYDPSTRPSAINDSGIDRKPVTGQGGAPELLEAAAPLMRRWASMFPSQPPRGRTDGTKPPPAEPAPPTKP